MVELVRKKLEAVKELRSFTLEILGTSPRIDEEKLSRMIDERQKYMDYVTSINAEIELHMKTNPPDSEEEGEIKELNSQIRELFKEMVSLDKEIRKNITDELKVVKEQLNQPRQSPGTVNIKA